MTDERQISKAVISRLPRYYRYLGELMEEGIERISSNELSARMKVTASQIRQDLNNFGGFGQQGYGYNVQYLYAEIAKILGIDRQHNIIIIGAGNLGQAIANYTNFEKRGFIIKGMFDINPRLIGLVVRGVEIRGINDLEQFIIDNEVQIAALTIPKTKAPEIAARLVRAGIKAIWNFAHTDLNVPDDVVVENVHLSESLMRLSYRVCSMQDERERREKELARKELAKKELVEKEPAGKELAGKGPAGKGPAEKKSAAQEEKDPAAGRKEREPAAGKKSAAANSETAGKRPPEKGKTGKRS